VCSATVNTGAPSFFLADRHYGGFYPPLAPKISRKTSGLQLNRYVLIEKTRAAVCKFVGVIAFAWPHGRFMTESFFTSAKICWIPSTEATVYFNGGQWVTSLFSAEALPWIRWGGSLWRSQDPLLWWDPSPWSCPQCFSRFLTNQDEQNKTSSSLANARDHCIVQGRFFAWRGFVPQKSFALPILW